MVREEAVGLGVGGVAAGGLGHHGAEVEVGGAGSPLGGLGVNEGDPGDDERTA